MAGGLILDFPGFQLEKNLRSLTDATSVLSPSTSTADCSAPAQQKTVPSDLKVTIFNILKYTIPFLRPLLPSF